MGWMVSLTPWPLYFRGKISRYPLIRRLGGSRCFVPKKSLVPAGIRTPGSSTMQPSLYRLSCWGLYVVREELWKIATSPNVHPRAWLIQSVSGTQEAAVMWQTVPVPFVSCLSRCSPGSALGLFDVEVELNAPIFSVLADASVVTVLRNAEWTRDTTWRRNARDDHLVTVVFPSGQGSQSKDRLVVSNFVCPNNHQISASGNSSN
jgi:hypothetical protein